MFYSGERIRGPVAGTTVATKKLWVGTLTWEFDNLLSRTVELAAGAGIDSWCAAVHARLTLTDSRRVPRTWCLLHKA